MRSYRENPLPGSDGLLFFQRVLRARVSAAPGLAAGLQEAAGGGLHAPRPPDSHPAPGDAEPGARLHAERLGQATGAQNPCSLLTRWCSWDLSFLLCEMGRIIPGHKQKGPKVPSNDRKNGTRSRMSTWHRQRTQRMGWDCDSHPTRSQPSQGGSRGAGDPLLRTGAQRQGRAARTRAHPGEATGVRASGRWGQN